MKFCKDCEQFKPHDPTQKHQSKASGFMGKVCWDCFVLAQRAKMQSRRDPVQSRSYGALILKAQSTLDKLKDVEATPEVMYQRNMAQCDLIRAQHKANRFGPDAYDFTPAELKRAKIGID